MRALRLSAWMAIVLAGFIVVVDIGLVIYTLRLPADISGALPTPNEMITLALLIAGAVRALRDDDSRFLIAAWAWRAGGVFPTLFRHVAVPEHVLASVPYARLGRAFVLGAGLVHIAIAVAGLGLALVRRASAR